MHRFLLKTKSQGVLLLSVLLALFYLSCSGSKNIRKTTETKSDAEAPPVMVESPKVMRWYIVVEQKAGLYKRYVELSYDGQMSQLTEGGRGPASVVFFAADSLRRLDRDIAEMISEKVNTSDRQDAILCLTVYSESGNVVLDTCWSQTSWENSSASARRLVEWISQQTDHFISVK